LTEKGPVKDAAPMRLCRPGIFCFFLSASAALSQVIQVRDAQKSPASAGEALQVAARLPESTLTAVSSGNVTLLPGLFRDRRELTRAYLLRLKTDDILQNHLLEAGVRIDKPLEQMHQGWESPHCQLRGHFAGHWLSAASHFAAVDQDPLLTGRVSEIVQGLKHCQELNHGEWVGSIPEKYFDILAEGKPIWSPQYTLHKTMMGLFDAYSYLHNTNALLVDQNSADWFVRWTSSLIQDGRSHVIYDGEAAGMLELWANLYGATRDPRYLTLASRYAMPDLFRQLLAGADPLTDNHANASIPWIQGAARLYEVTGDPRYRQIVETFWKQGVENRGMFATTGNNAGEFWIPPGQFGRFLGNRTQEHCTVYNMIRVAQYLLRWTGDSRYADYIERALYNGILAQQNRYTGMVSYFLPLQPGAKKDWGTETHDFWCCHGTMVQAQAMYEELIYYTAPDGVAVSQFIPSQATLEIPGGKVRITQTFDTAGARSDFTNQADITHTTIELNLAPDQEREWTLRVRQPAWATAPGTITVNGTPVSASVSRNGFLEIRRTWTAAQVKVTFSKQVTREPLPGDKQRFALLDGPIVLAALANKEPELSQSSEVLPQYEHQYLDGREWKLGHYLVHARDGTVAVKPLYEIADESYCVYFASAGR
jgi:DUF1680 family protein